MPKTYPAIRKAGFSNRDAWASYSGSPLVTKMARPFLTTHSTAAGLEKSTGVLPEATSWLISSMVYSFLNRIAYLSISYWVVDKVTMFERMTVRTNDGQVLKCVVLAVSILVVESENLRMFIVSAPLASIDRPAAFFESSAESGIATTPRPCFQSAFAASKSCVIRLSLWSRKVFSAAFAGVQLRSLEASVTGLRTTLSRAICLRLPSLAKSRKLYSTEEALTKVFGLNRPPFAVAFLRAKTSISSPGGMYVKLRPALPACLVFASAYLVFTTLWTTHDAIIYLNLVRCNHG